MQLRLPLPDHCGHGPRNALNTQASNVRVPAECPCLANLFWSNGADSSILTSEAGRFLRATMDWPERRYDGVGKN